MLPVKFVARRGVQACLVMLAVVAVAPRCKIARGTEVAFDLPSSIECRDVTPANFATANPTLKVVEAKVRISARLVEGTPAEIVEFFYVLRTARAMRVKDYLPNTKLESAVAEDHIEVTDATENGKTTAAEAQVLLNPFGLGGSHSQSSKKSESSHYKQIAAKDLVLASGTIDREHGVFFRLRPSRTDSLEGGKEFAVVAIVPKGWRGGLCTISCTAKANKRSMVSTSIVPSGSEQTQIGMYLAGDLDAAGLAEDLRLAQDAHAHLLKQARSTRLIQTISTETASLITGRAARQRQEQQKSEQAVADLQHELESLSE
jgi:hypothetical protein